MAFPSLHFGLVVLLVLQIFSGSKATGLISGYCKKFEGSGEDYVYEFNAPTGIYSMTYDFGSNSKYSNYLTVYSGSTTVYRSRGRVYGKHTVDNIRISSKLGIVYIAVRTTNDSPLSTWNIEFGCNNGAKEMQKCGRTIFGNMGDNKHTLFNMRSSSGGFTIDYNFSTRSYIHGRYNGYNSYHSGFLNGVGTTKAEDIFGDLQSMELAVFKLDRSDESPWEITPSCAGAETKCGETVTRTINDESIFYFDMKEEKGVFDLTYDFQRTARVRVYAEEEFLRSTTLSRSGTISIKYSGSSILAVSIEPFSNAPMEASLTLPCPAKDSFPMDCAKSFSGKDTKTGCFDLPVSSGIFNFKYWMNYINPSQNFKRLYVTYEGREVYSTTKAVGGGSVLAPFNGQSTTICVTMELHRPVPNSWIIKTRCPTVAKCGENVHSEKFSNGPATQWKPHHYAIDMGAESGIFEVYYRFGFNTFYGHKMDVYAQTSPALTGIVRMRKFDGSTGYLRDLAYEGSSIIYTSVVTNRSSAIAPYYFRLNCPTSPAATHKCGERISGDSSLGRKSEYYVNMEEESTSYGKQFFIHWDFGASPSSEIRLEVYFQGQRMHITHYSNGKGQKGLMFKDDGTYPGRLVKIVTYALTPSTQAWTFRATCPSLRLAF